MPRAAPDSDAFADCHGCGARLRVEDHYYLETQTHEDSHEDRDRVELEASFELRWVHIPCPHCDEPKPISSLRHTWHQPAAIAGFGIVIVAIFGAIGWLMLS